MEWISTHSFWVYLLIILFSAFISYWTYWKQPKTIFNKGQRWVLTILRFLLFCLLGFVIFSPFLKFNFSKEEKPKILVAIDKSASVGGGLGTSGSKSLMDALYQNIEKYEDEFDIDTMSFGSDIRAELYGEFADKKTDIASFSNHISDKYYESNLKEILLVTDGYATEGAAPFQSDYLLDAPISLVTIGDTALSPDYAVTLVQMPAVVLMENQVVVNAELSCNNARAKQATVKVLVDGKVMQSDMVQFSGSNDLQNRQYSLAIKNKGQHSVCVQIQAKETESNLSNNSRCGQVEISQESIKVALLYQSPHPDIGAIDRSLSSFQNIKLSKTKSVPSASSADVVIAHNITSPTVIDQVKKTGAGLMIVNGIRSGAQNWQKTFSELKVVPSSAELQPQLKEGFDVFDIQFVPNTWVTYLPPLVNNGTALSAGSSAEVFMENSRNTPIVTYERGGQNILVTNGEGLWRWRMAEKRETSKSLVFDEWLRQSILFLRPSANKNRFEIRQNKSQYMLGENILWTGQFYNDNGVMDNDGEVTIQLKGANGTKKYRMNKSSNGYALALSDLAPGSYQFTATYRKENTIRTRSGRFSIQNVDIEQVHDEVNMEFVDELIYGYGGQMLMPSQISSWWESVAQKGYKNRLVKEQKLQRMIDIKWFLFMMLFLLILEWILRKWFGSI